MPDDGRARALDAFIAELNAAWRIAGPPSYAEAEEVSRCLEAAARPVFGVRVIALPKSTVNDLLRSRRLRPPRWQLVASFWAVLRVVAIRGSVNPDRIGTLDEWRRKYEAVAAPAPAPAAAAAGGWPASRRTGGRLAAAPAGRRGAAPPPGGAAGAGPLADRPPADADEARRAWLLALTRQARPHAWWRDYRDVVPEWFEDYLSLEPEASVIQTYEPRFVPGLLQTPEYARALIGHGRPGAAPAEVARRVELRMRRQEILRRPDAPQLWATVDERVLRPGPAARSGAVAAVLRAQVAHLIELAALPHVKVQVMPAGGGAHAALDGPVTHLRFPGRDTPDVIYLEQRTYALYPERSNDVSHYWGMLGSLAIAAEQPGESVARLRRVLREL